MRHKALKSFLISGNSKGIDGRLVNRLRNMFAYLHAAGSPDELHVPPNFGFHWLSGDRQGTAAMLLTRNWRLTFRVTERYTLIDIDLEDYH